jgi:hypothetical protein
MAMLPRIMKANPPNIFSEALVLAEDRPVVCPERLLLRDLGG